MSKHDVPADIVVSLICILSNRHFKKYIKNLINKSYHLFF